MKDWFTGRYPEELWHAIVTLGFVLGAYVLAWIVRLVWRGALLPIARRTSTKFDQILLQKTEFPVFLAVVCLGAHVGMQRLVRIETLASSFYLNIVEETVGVLLILAMALVANAVLSAVLEWYLTEIAVRTQTDIDNQLVPIFGRVLRIIIFFIALTIILGQFEVKITAILGAAGVASLAVALAAQETIANMISGFTILVDRPFRVGDRIELGDGRIGDVREIGLRSTKILSFDNTVLIIPNSEISKSSVINHSYPDPTFRVRTMVSVAYGTDPDRVKSVLLEIAAANPKILEEPLPVVHFREFGDSSLNFLFTFSIADLLERFVVLDAVNTAIARRFAEGGIEIPFPQRDLHLRSGRWTGA